ncbi:FAD/NAD(P)-binding protein [Rhizobium sp. BK251]|uniref:FAD/NAD(P)-binding protein n=1 Tax=Rhizobium sp. BK251 TaxID=2512125 RepID=UPI00104B5673|nr:FAD/NAD(P)-binding protein [Rhizobium sp. BK251]TCL71465.1 putative NAD(P)/FAD-binding protein YdhS [Rhizobium sp. BK251]
MIYDVVVVGSGFSAIATVCNLIELLPASSAIAVIGDDPGFGRGTAYRTELYLHRLNVPAARMSLFPDRPDAFVQWLSEHDRSLSAGDFASRNDYGLYVRDTLASLLRNRKSRCRVDFIKAKATGCMEQYRSSLAFFLDNGDEIAARSVVLCLGVGNAKLPVDLGHLSAAARTRVVKNPWRLSWLHKVGAKDRVCILGSGLTMIDQVLALSAHGFEGQVDVLSRRGLAPHGHSRNPHHAASIDIAALPTRMSKLLRSLRDESRKTGDWRDVMDGLRPQTQALWQRLDKSERARFLRHALPWWNIHRHRVGPEVFQRFQDLVHDGKVVLHAGYLQEIEETNDGLRLRYRARGRKDVLSLDADWVVNCTGMERAGIDHSPLLREMLRQKLISADPLRLGIAVDGQSRVSRSGEEKGVQIHAVGALTAGQFWEITAVPDIRVQARQVAQVLAGASPPVSDARQF